MGSLTVFREGPCKSPGQTKENLLVLKSFSRKVKSFTVLFKDMSVWCLFFWRQWLYFDQFLTISVSHQDIINTINGNKKCRLKNIFRYCVFLRCRTLCNRQHIVILLTCSTRSMFIAATLKGRTWLLRLNWRHYLKSSLTPCFKGCSLKAQVKFGLKQRNLRNESNFCHLGTN